MTKTLDTRGWPVMPASCKSCPFGEQGDPGVRENVITRLLTFSHSQICHHPALVGKMQDHLCRGARNFQQTILYRMGVLDSPTDAAWERASTRKDQNGDQNT